MVNDRYLEDFHVGDRFRSADHAMTEIEIVEFARKYDPQPFHVDPVAARESLFGGLVASGWQTASITMRLLAQSDINVAGGLVGMGVEELRWPAPVRPGDRLRVETEVLEVRPSQSHPDHGIVRVNSRTLNQSGQEVQTMRTALWVPRRLGAGR
jgi:acyl dehydratase